MARDVIQIPADGAGKRLDAYSYLSTVAGTPTVYAQASVSVSSDGSVTFPPSAALSDAYATPTASSIGAVNYAYNGTSFDFMREANAAANSTGTGLLGVGSLAFDGTNWQRMGGVVGDTGQNSQLVSGARKEVPFTTTTVQAVGATDVSNYRWVSVHITSQGTASTITFQGSNDNANWVNVALITAGSGTSWTTTTAAANVLMTGPVNYRYFRLNVTGISAGTTAGTLEFFAVPSQVPYASGTVSVPADAFAAGSGLQAVGFNMVFNGASWDRWRGTGLSADTGTAVVAVRIQSSSTATTIQSSSGLAADANNGAAIAGVGIYAYNGSTFDRLRSATGATSGTLATAPQSATAGGATPFKLLSAASTNATSVKASAGTVYAITAINANAAVRYLKLYDKASAPTVGTDVPVHVLPLSVSTGHPLNITLPTGMAFANGIALAITGGIADTDTTAVALNDVAVNLAYK